MFLVILYSENTLGSDGKMRDHQGDGSRPRNQDLADNSFDSMDECCDTQNWKIIVGYAVIEVQERPSVF
jgi:hypothetical protein